MKEPTCSEITEALVDYADGELSAEAATTLRTHLAGCPLCRARLDALRRSLALAWTIWEENEQSVWAGAQTPEPRRSRTGLWAKTPSRGLIAAGLAILIGAGLLRGLGHRQVAQLNGPTTTSGHRPAAACDHAEALPTAPSLQEIEAEIAAAGAAARLLAAADLLAAQAAGRDIACQRYHYILATYPNTPAALECEVRLASVCKQRDEP